jgi:hypothetical protein
MKVEKIIFFFFRAAKGCRMTEHKQNGNNKRTGDNMYQYNNTNNERNGTALSVQNEG